MQLRTLETVNYRNLQNAKLRLFPGVTSIVGGNAQGKSNLLEAAYLVLTGIMGTQRVETLVALGEQEAFVAAELEREDGFSKLEVGLKRGSRVAKVDGARVRSGEVARFASAVLIRPEDAELVHGSPSMRRAYLDDLVVKISPRYAQVLQVFERSVTQRNAALKQQQLDVLEVFDERVATLGDEIMRYRRRCLVRLSLLANESHAALTNNGKALGVALRESAPENGFLEALQRKRAEELARGTTVIGPHRDDLVLTLNNLQAADFASRGEARTVALALRQAEFALLSEKFNEAPVLLIDDFSAELDASRREALLGMARAAPQALVTGTEAPTGTGQQRRLWRIENGSVVA